MLESLQNRIRSRILWESYWRCQEPVVVFESDDWGLFRKPCSDQLQPYGEPGQWAEEAIETEEDLDALQATLSQHVDPSGRPANFTANFVVANPDFEAIEETGFSQYIDIPIDRDSTLLEKWHECVARRLFRPQYHARFHACPEQWLRDLQEDTPGARELCRNHCHGGLALIKGQGWRYHSEYYNWEKGTQLEPKKTRKWLQESLAIFERTFGFKSTSTMVPHYILTPETVRILDEAGFRSLQGGNYRLLKDRHGKKRVLQHPIGSILNDDFIFLGRNTKFDPRPQRPDNGVGPALARLKQCFESNVPGVIDTHRINFTGAWGREGIRSLGELLTALKEWKPLFVTSDELAEAITNDGNFHDVWSGEPRRLTPIDGAIRQHLRQRINATSDARAND